MVPGAMRITHRQVCGCLSGAQISSGVSGIHFPSLEQPMKFSGIAREDL